MNTFPGQECRVDMGIQGNYESIAWVRIKGKTMEVQSYPFLVFIDDRIKSINCL